MRPAIAVSISQPCAESWAAMTPTATGRHCAACAKTVVDFTLKSDAEILAYLAQAAGARTCGRFAAGQLERPLQRAVSAAPTPRWRAWLAAILAVWGLRETVSIAAKAQAPMEDMRKMGKPVLVPEQLRASRKPDYEGSSASENILRGVVSEHLTREELPGVSIIIKGTTSGTATNESGSFELVLPTEYSKNSMVTLQIRCLGYVTQERQLQLTDSELLLHFQMDIESMGDIGYTIMPPAPWHPRSLYYWGKYWLTRPFRRF